MNMGERPLYALKRKTAANLRIVKHVIVIIVVNKLVVERLAKRNPGNRCQEKAHQTNSQPVSAAGWKATCVCGSFVVASRQNGWTFSVHARRADKVARSESLSPIGLLPGPNAN